jgi:hypothetical protein
MQSSLPKEQRALSDDFEKDELGTIYFLLLKFLDDRVERKETRRKTILSLRSSTTRN